MEDEREWKFNLKLGFKSVENLFSFNAFKGCRRRIILRSSSKSIVYELFYKLQFSNTISLKSFFKSIKFLSKQSQHILFHFTLSWAFLESFLSFHINTFIHQKKEIIMHFSKILFKSYTFMIYATLFDVLVYCVKFHNSHWFLCKFAYSDLYKNTEKFKNTKNQSTKRC